MKVNVIYTANIFIRQQNKLTSCRKRKFLSQLRRDVKQKKGKSCSIHHMNHALILVWELLSHRGSPSGLVKKPKNDRKQKALNELSHLYPLQNYYHGLYKEWYCIMACYGFIDHLKSKQNKTEKPFSLQDDKKTGKNDNDKKSTLRNSLSIRLSNSLRKNLSESLSSSLGNLLCTA